MNSYLDPSTAAAAANRQRPSCARRHGSRMDIRGPLGRYIANVTTQWLTVAPTSNPAMLEMFRDRERLPDPQLLPWSGEFAGKHLVSAAQIYRVTRDNTLREFIAQFVRRLTALQADNGYLGPFAQKHQLTGYQEHGETTWDLWGHYHIMMGLLLWEEDTLDPWALAGARKIGDLLCTKFETARVVDTHSCEMNLAPIHSLCLLHRRTGEARYFKLALKICDEFGALDVAGKMMAGDYLQSALAGKEFFQSPKPRWESLHAIMGLAELHRLTGEEKYRQAFEHWWWSIVKFDRHNNGGFSSDEQAQGDPYHQGKIETCCSIAWSAMTVEMLRLTRNPVVADELELTLLNTVIGLHSPSGRWVTYNTPMDGCKKASAHEIAFQARAGSPELNCCSVNGPRGFGLMSDWAVMKAETALLVNWYGPSAVDSLLDNGARIKLVQETDYPRTGHVRLAVSPSIPTAFTLHLRIPQWSETTRVTLNGQPLTGVRAGSYLEIKRTWKTGDVIELDFDFSLHFWRGENACAGKVSIYRGPILLTYVRRLNPMDADAIPPLDVRGLQGKLLDATGELAPIVLLEFAARDGRTLRLCDFGSAGLDGSDYRSWLEVSGIGPAEFRRDHTLPTSRPE